MEMAKQTIKGKFKPSASAESRFWRALKKVGQTSGHIVDSYYHDLFDVTATPKMMKALKDYADLITPWATKQSAKMLDAVMKSNARAYKQKSKVLGRAYQAGLGNTEVGGVAARLLLEQVALIRSIPLEAGERAQKIAYEAAIHGTRARPDEDTILELQKQLGLSTDVATSRAMLIARTETARATASINQARAMSAGAKQYRWHNSGDAAVRESHKTYRGKPLQGRVFSWDDPPTLSDGMKGHPGTFPNCRCFAEPVFDDE
jgi:SPP1 gp7 family putative phage head morphogenesis protein